MWARLQGVGISVRADTALPWPLPLLHKTSQPALSPGLESVSAATCQIKTERNKRKRKRKKKPCPSRLPPCVTNHPSPPSLLSFLCLIADELRLWERPATTSAFRQSNAACLSYKPCLPFCLSSLRVTHHQSNLGFFFFFMMLSYQVWGQNVAARWQLWPP